jgi:hypothetical protein
MAVTGRGTVWGTSRIDQVGPFDPKDTSIEWRTDDSRNYPYAQYFNKDYMWIEDPRCGQAEFVSQATTGIPYNLQSMSYVCGQPGTGNRAVAEVASYDASGIPVPGQVIFQNAIPGQIGNKRRHFITSPGSWTLDTSMAKRVEFMEGKTFELRVDAQNIFNHPSPSFNTNPITALPTTFSARATSAANPNVSLNDTQSGVYKFGEINSKTGHRTFQARIRLSF